MNNIFIALFLTFAAAAATAPSNPLVDVKARQLVNTSLLPSATCTTPGFGAAAMLNLNVTGAAALIAADFNGDGFIDLASANTIPNVGWSANDGKGNFGEIQEVTMLASGTKSIASGDIDGDGTIDLLSLSVNDGKVAWYPNVDGTGNFGEQHIIHVFDKNGDLRGGHHSIAVGDMDGDGDLDLNVADYIGGKIVYFENTDGKGTFDLITRWGQAGATVLKVGDLNGDGHPDIAAGADSWGLTRYLSYYLDPGIPPAMGGHSIKWTSSPITGLALGDIDLDGKLDITALYTHSIKSYSNKGGSFDHGKVTLITQNAGYKPILGELIDIDGDGRLDLTSGNSASVMWYRNTYNPQTDKWSLSSGMRFGGTSIQDLASGDFDGDGWIDVASASGVVDNPITWYRNTCGGAE